MTSARYTQDKTAKMYACSIATKNSNPTNTITSANGKSFSKSIMLTIAPPITCNKICPEVMFAARRNDKLIGFAKNEKSSITAISGASHRGHPLGKNSLKNPKPCEKIPNAVMTINTTKDKANVIAIWLVVAKLFGNIPHRFEDKTNRKMLNIKGTNFFPLSSPIVLPTILKTALCINSADNCNFEGTDFGSRRAIHIYVRHKELAIAINKLALVNVKSIPKGTNLNKGDTKN
jgi:hypothetical protein